MSREILFKAKHIHALSKNDHLNGRWIEGYLSDEDYINSLELEGEFLINKATICQYTGLKDKNGKKIWEHDILKGFQYPYFSDGEYNYFAEVIWFDNCPAFGLYTFKNPKSNVRGVSEGNTEFMEEWVSEDWEVIGNIFDNPELLKG